MSDQHKALTEAIEMAQKCISALNRALHLTRPGALEGGAMEAPAPQATAAPPPAAQAPAPGGDGGQPVSTYSGGMQGAAPSGNLYDMVMSRLAQAQSQAPAYRAYQPSDFAAPVRRQWQFDPATDPSRMLNARLRAQKEAAAAAAAAAASATPSYGEQGVPSWDYGNGG